MKALTNGKILFFATMLYFVFAYIEDTVPGGQIVMIVSLALMLFTFAAGSRCRMRAKDNGILVYLLLFLAFCYASTWWARDPSLASSKINGVFFNGIAILVMNICYNNQNRMNKVEDFIKIVLYGGYVIVLYIFVRFGVGGIMRMAANDERLTNELLNANTLGLCAAYSLVINFYYILSRRKFQWADLLMVPAFVLLIVSQSRKAILVVVLGVIGAYLLKNIGVKKNAQKYLKILLGMLVITAVMVFVARLEVMAPIMNRIYEIFEMMAGLGKRGVNSAWIRFAYTELGLQLFKENPLLGIGIGNANIYTQMYYGHNHYLHNNFIELLACGGLVGFGIYYSIYAYFLWVFWKNRKYRDMEYNICLLLLVLVLIMDYGAVSYYSKSTYFMLFVFWLEARKLKRAEIQRKQNAIMKP